MPITDVEGRGGTGGVLGRGVGGGAGELQLEGNCNLRGNLRASCTRVEKHTSRVGMLAAIQSQQRVASAYFGCPATLSLFTEILEVPASHARRGSCNTCHLLVRQVLGVLVQDLSSADLVWQPKLD